MDCEGDHGPTRGSDENGVLHVNAYTLRQVFLTTKIRTSCIFLAQVFITDRA